MYLKPTGQVGRFGRGYVGGGSQERWGEGGASLQIFLEESDSLSPERPFPKCGTLFSSNVLWKGGYRSVFGSVRGDQGLGACE